MIGRQQKDAPAFVAIRLRVTRGRIDEVEHVVSTKRNVRPSKDAVLVVGAGPVGLLTALGLARAGISVMLLEGEPAIVESPRAAVYHWSVLAGLERLGILEEAKRTGFSKQDSCYLVFKTRETIPFSLAPLADYVPYPYNVHLGQHVLARIALDHLQRLPGVAVHWNTRVTGLSQDATGVTVAADTPEGSREFRASWVVGADGARSTVRHALGLEFEGMTWSERRSSGAARFSSLLLRSPSSSSG